MTDFDEAAAVEAMAKRPAVEEFIRLTSSPASHWGMADSDVVDLCNYILHLEAALAALKPFLGMADSVRKDSLHTAPEGWALVPKEPTIEMLVAGTEEWLTRRAQEERAGVIWKAMLAASPDKGGE